MKSRTLVQQRRSLIAESRTIELPAKSDNFRPAPNGSEKPCSSDNSTELSSVALQEPLGDLLGDNHDDIQQPLVVAVMGQEETVFQRRLKRTRRRRGYTQKTLTAAAKAAGGPTERQYAEWERGLTKRAHAGKLKAIADVLGVDPLWLEGDEEDDEDGIPSRDS